MVDIDLKLLPKHEAMLRASAIDPSVAAERGYQSITSKAELERLGFKRWQCGVPSLLVPIHSAGGGVALYHHRPDTPRLDARGKIVKYEFPKSARMAVDVHPRILDLIRDPIVPLFITEGIKKADAAICGGLCCIAVIGTWNWRGTNERGGKTVLPDWDYIAFKDANDRSRQVYICYDSDVMLKREVHQALARLAAFLKSKGASVAFIYLPHGEHGAKVGLDDYLAAGHTSADVLRLASPSPHESVTDGASDADDEVEGDASGDGETVSQRLVALAAGVDLFHTERGENFARFDAGGHLETWPVRSQAFRQWIGRGYYKTFGKPAGSQPLEDALRVLEGAARYDGELRSLSVRCARDPDDASVWLDMGDADWRAIQVKPGAWEITCEPPPLFRRHVTGAAFAAPDAIAAPAEIELLRPFLNVRSEGAWKQIVAWLVAAWLPEIGHPVLVVHGEQGTAKSTLMRMLTLLIDPSHTPLRCEPCNKAEWAQTADHTWLVTLDNVSSLPAWLSDAMCRAVTGEAFLKRQLYTDAEEIIMAFRRVVALTGIEVVAQRSDLLDRSILLGLEPIEPGQRRPESEVLAAFEAVRPKIVGALLNILSGVLAELPRVDKLPSLPRMADFARVGVAVGRVLRWEEGAFLSAYQNSIKDHNDEALGAVPIAEPLLAFVEGQWSGTSSELLQALTAGVSEATARRREWPQSAKALTGQLRRIAPNLRAIGVDVAEDRTRSKRRIYITRKSPEKSVTSVTSVTPSSERGPGRDTSASIGDTSDSDCDTLEPEVEVEFDDFVREPDARDTCDGCDAFLQALSLDVVDEDDDGYIEAIRR
jgi:hypothetical protein